MSAVLMTYMMQDAPALIKKAEEFHDAPVNEDAWAKLIQDMFENKSIYEFHVYKVGGRVLWKRVCQFLITSNHLKDFLH